MKKNTVTSWVRLVNNNQVDYLEDVDAKNAIKHLFTDDTGAPVEVFVIEAVDEKERKLTFSLWGDGGIGFKIEE